MSNFLCLSEIEERVILHNSLTGHDRLPSNLYCVLTEMNLIIFKKPNDIFSIKRLPLTENVKVTANTNQFSILICELKFTFSSEDSIIIASWVSKLFSIIDYKLTLQPIINFEFAEVKINRGNSNQDFFILIGDSDYKLYLYESYEYHRLDIVAHEINLKYYTIENTITRSSSDLYRSSLKSIRLVGKNIKIKITFQQEELVQKWMKIFRKAIDDAFSNTKSDLLSEVYKNESNKFCAECGGPNPGWVSINLCVTVCINCAGQHRSLGTSYSRIQSIMIDEQIWKDTNLIKLLQEIGNEKSNSFWLKNRSGHLSFTYENPNFIREKYVLKSFIDKELADLSESDYKSRLQESVTSSDIFLTMRLWNSMNFHCDPEFVSLLIRIAQNSRQMIQEKFLSLQPIYFNSNVQENRLSANTVIQMSYNDLEVINNLFLVSISNNCISIKVEAPIISPIELIEVGSILYDDISLVWYDCTDDVLIVSLNPEYPSSRIYKNLSNQNVNVNRIKFLNQSKQILKNFKFELLKMLLPNHFVPLTEDSNLYVNTHLKISGLVNSKELKCKFHLTDHDIIFHKPLEVSYNLKKSCDRVLSDDLNLIRAKFGPEEIEIVTHNAHDHTIIQKYLDCHIIIRKLQLEESKIPIHIVRMIEFISFRGLDSEGIFRVNGATKNVNSLFDSIEKSTVEFFIDPVIYSVYDVASCLKKYFRSLDEPLIPNDLFEEFRQTSYVEDIDEKISKYKTVVQSLPELSYAILRRLLELFLMIQMKDNRMDSESLAISAASSLVSFESYNYQTSGLIMKDLIDNFVSVFDYSKKEQEIFELFVKDSSACQHPTSLIRTFHVHPQLFRSMKNRKYQFDKLAFLAKDCTFLTIHLNVDDCHVVQDIYKRIFNEPSCELWHVLTKGSGLGHKTLKRMIYFHESVSNTVARPKHISNYNSCFVLFPQQSVVEGNNFRLFRSEIKLKSDKYQDFTLMLTYPHSLTFSKRKSSTKPPDYSLTLSEIVIYRFHAKNVRKVFIFYDGDKGFLKIKFSEDQDFREFLYFYDQFRNQTSDQL